MPKLVLSENAFEDLIIVYDHIKMGSEDYAKNYIDGLLDSLEKLVDFPRIGRMVPERNVETIREIIYKQHRLIYVIIDDKINVVTISHTRMDYRSFEDKIPSSPE